MIWKRFARSADIFVWMDAMRVLIGVQKELTRRKDEKSTQPQRKVRKKIPPQISFLFIGYIWVQGFLVHVLL